MNDGRAFCDGTRRYGVLAPFFPRKEKPLFVMYYYKRISDFRLVSTGIYYLVPAPISLQKSPGEWEWMLKAKKQATIKTVVGI